MDHYFANRILMRSINDIWCVIPKDYGGELTVLDRMTALLDRPAAALALIHYRGRVWDYAVRLLRSSSGQETNGIVREMDDVSASIAEKIAAQSIFAITAWQKIAALQRRQDYAGLCFND
jgi:hypothetical protein